MAEHDLQMRSAEAPQGEQAQERPAGGISAALLQRKLQRRLQRRAEGHASAETDVEAAAQLGTRGPAEPLPHLAAIQASFGHHDVSGVAAHSDAAAAQGAQALGATAFATGNHVAFRGAPDLHTAAHEAAHVVQQRGGVSLLGGVGQAGDPHEQHADAVADRVVAGRSAADLLDQYQTGGGHAGKAVQRIEYPDTIAPPHPQQQGNQISNDALNQAVVAQLPNHTHLQQIQQALTLALGDLAQQAPHSANLVTLAGLVTEAQTLGRAIESEVRAVVNQYNVLSQNSKVPAQAKLAALVKLIPVGRARRPPQIQVVAQQDQWGARPEDAQREETMKDVEERYDVLGRKSSAPPVEAPGAIHEADLAFLEHMRGFPDIRATLNAQQQPTISEDPSGEKVYAVGSTGAINFGGVNSNVGGERCYGVLFPKGWVAKYGQELRNHDRSASAREPNVNEFAAHKYTDRGHYSGQATEVNLGADKAFAIRGEKATSQEGQVDIHYNFSNMTINGRQTSLIDFCRQSALGVVEFDLQGKVLHVRMF